MGTTLGNGVQVLIDFVIIVSPSCLLNQIGQNQNYKNALILSFVLTYGVASVGALCFLVWI